MDYYHKQVLKLYKHYQVHEKIEHLTALYQAKAPIEAIKQSYHVATLNRAIVGEPSY